jgi:peroxiredoxin Q/BCP
MSKWSSRVGIALVLAAFASMLVIGCAKESPGSSTTASGATAAPALEVGKPAPDFSVTASDGTALKLADLKGKPVVMYFYPKDETPGCTKEACAFRDSFEALKKQGVVLIGVSSDSDASHRAFAENHKLPFYLVSDEKGDLAKKFGVETTFGFMKRQSFVIGADGNIKKIYRSVNVDEHAQQIQDDLKS